MTTYNSYEEAKIANPDQDIYLDESIFGTWRYDQIKSGTKCNPADHCMTVEKFLADGHKFELGDICLDDEGCVINIDVEDHTWNKPDNLDVDRFILRASALEEKPKRVKVDYVKVEDSIFDLRPDFEAGELFVRIGDNYEVVLSAQCLATSLAVGSCYRKVETEIDERQEFIDECMAHGGLRARDGAREVYGNIFDSGKFKLVNAD